MIIKQYGILLLLFCLPTILSAGRTKACANKKPLFTVSYTYALEQLLAEAMQSSSSSQKATLFAMMQELMIQRDQNLKRPTSNKEHREPKKEPNAYARFCNNTRNSCRRGPR